MSRSSEPIRQAVILAGGQATRLRPYTDTRPKAMVEVAGRPIIDYQLEWLARHGVEHVVVSCGYKAEVLREHLSDRKSTRLNSSHVKISYAVFCLKKKKIQNKKKIPYTTTI